MSRWEASSSRRLPFSVPTLLSVYLLCSISYSTALVSLGPKTKHLHQPSPNYDDGHPILIRRHRRQPRTTIWANGASSAFPTILQYRNREAHEEQVAILSPAVVRPKDDTARANTSSVLRELCRSQLFLLGLATMVGMALHGGDVLTSLQWANADTTTGLSIPGNLLCGVLGAIPMILVSHFGVERATHRDAHHVQFATQHAVISLFGERREPTATMTTIASSLGLTAVTALSEELVFRGFLPTAVETLIGSWMVAWLVQAVVFGLGHLHPMSHPGENKLVGEMQTLHGLWLGLLFVGSGGNLLPCIVSHMLYDMHVFVETWHHVNNQLDWSREQATQAPLPQEAQLLRELQVETNVSNETLHSIRMFFWAFDRHHQNVLTLDDVQCAVSYAFRYEAAPRQQLVAQLFRELEGSATSKMGQADFCRLLLILRRQQKT